MSHRHCNETCWLQTPAPFVTLGSVIALELAIAAALVVQLLFGHPR